jgi:hypothetical protein
MGGVDLADQLFSYYRPNLRCVRTWMPIFLHCLDIVRVNAVIVHKRRRGGDPKFEQKVFICEWVQRLNQRADLIDYQMTRNAVATFATPPQERNTTTKRRRLSHTAQLLPPNRLNGPRTNHLAVMGDKKTFCIYCPYLYHKARIEKVDPLPKRRKVRRSCSECRVTLCSGHFNVFHEWDDAAEASPDEVHADQSDTDDEDEDLAGVDGRTTV